MYTIINKKTKQYVNKNWEFSKDFYTHDLDLAIKYASYAEAELYVEETEEIYEIVED